MQHTYEEMFTTQSLLRAFRPVKELLIEADLEAATCAADIYRQTRDTSIHVTEIGAGDGRVSATFLSHVQKSLDILSYTDIDVSQTLVEEATKLLRKILPKTDIDAIVADASTPQQLQSPDLILSIHSWYGLTLHDIPPYIEQLAPNGRFLMIINSQDSFPVHISQDFGNLTPTNGEQVEEYLTQQGIPYRSYKQTLASPTQQQFLHNLAQNPESDNLFLYLTRQPINTEEIKQQLTNKPDSYFQQKQCVLLIEKPANAL